MMVSGHLLWVDYGLPEPPSNDLRHRLGVQVDGPSKLCQPTKELFVVVFNPRSHLNSSWILLVTLFASKSPSCQDVNGQRTHLSRARYLQLINDCLCKYSRPRRDTPTKLLWVHQQVRLKFQAATIAESLINPTMCINMS
jgi:hypothetical protein